MHETFLRKQYSSYMNLSTSIIERLICFSDLFCESSFTGKMPCLTFIMIKIKQILRPSWERCFAYNIKMKYAWLKKDKVQHYMFCYLINIDKRLFYCWLNQIFHTYLIPILLILFHEIKRMEHYKIYSMMLELACYSECIKTQQKENYRTLFLMIKDAEICNKVLVNQI